MKNQKLLRNLNSKGRYLTLLLTVTAGLLYCSSAWADYGFYSDGAWNMRYWNGSEDHWFPNNSGYSMGATYDMGIISSSYYINGCWVNTYAKDGDCVKWIQFNWSKDNTNWGRKAWGFWNWECKSGDPVTFSSIDQSQDISIKLSDYAVNNPGKNTLYFYFDVQNNSSTPKSSTSSKVDFTLPGWSTTSGNAAIGTATVGSSVSKEDISLGTHYGDSDGCTTDVGGTNASDFSVTAVTASKITVKFTPTAVGERTATITITDKYGKTRTLTVTGKGNFTPTVLIGAKEQIVAQDVTLFGYVKYTGCKNINKVGFIASQTRSEVEGATPTATKYEGTATADPIEAGTDFSFSSDEFENEIYYYRAWMKASDGTEVYSDEIRTFEPQGVCNAVSASDILPIFKSGKTTESATFIESSASIDLTVEKESIADVYHWNVSPAAGVSFSAQTSRNTSVTVSAVGTYTFTLTAGCTDGTQYTSERTLTLYVCAPAEETQLYLDNHTVNVICVGEEATATCITKEGYTYALYNPDGESLGSLAGTGGKQTWRHVNGAGVFTMRTSPTSMPECAAVVSSATQSYNEPTLEITADPGLSVISYQPVTLSKKDVTSDTYVDTNPTWVISTGSDKGYLLNEHNRLAYDNRARESVVFKGGAADAATIKVQASAYKTVNVVDPDEKVENYTKQCPTTTEVTLTVSPAVDDCPQP